MSTAPVNPASVSSSTSAIDAETLRRGRILSSKLYFDVPLTKVPIIYSSSYDIAFLGMEKLHPFDSSKWGRICQFLILDGALEKNHIVEPLEASKDDLLVVHSESYLNSLKTSLNVAVIIEVPPVALLPNCLVQRKVLYPFRKQLPHAKREGIPCPDGIIPPLHHFLYERSSWKLNMKRSYH